MVRALRGEEAAMVYVDGFVIPVARKKVAAYKRMAEWGKRTWMRHGALAFYECLGDDLTHMPGCGSFPDMASLAKGETVFFSFIIYRSKAHRNAVNKRVMAELQKAPMPTTMPFDPKRMAFGGFKAIVQATARSGRRGSR